MGFLQNAVYKWSQLLAINVAVAVIFKPNTFTKWLPSVMYRKKKMDREAGRQTERKRETHSKSNRTEY